MGMGMGMGIGTTRKMHQMDETKAEAATLGATHEL